MGEVLDFRLDGKVAIVTGASQGIGLAIGEALAAAGADVVLQGRDEKRLTTAAEAVGARGGRVLAVAVELTDEDAPEKLVRAALEGLGRLDVLVNNAAIFEPAPFEEGGLASFDRHVAINLRAPYALTQAAIPHLLDGGSVIFISSIAGHAAFPNSAAYCATKGAIELLTKSLAVEYGPRGVRVNAVAPGNIKTAMNAPFRAQPGYEVAMDARTPFGRHGDPEEIAGAVVFLASEAGRYAQGASFLVDGGWLAQ
jgi:NAD(P)-dependent dehydrogenase (short-subunit alcohol dehydrogenase family)